MNDPPPSKHAEKARRAASDPRRPGADCKAEPGSFMPVVDRARCEAKGDCVLVCPYDVFAVRRIDDQDFAALGFLSKLKVIAHGKKSSYTVNAGACRACGLCVVACPEDAIALVRADAVRG